MKAIFKITAEETLYCFKCNLIPYSIVQNFKVVRQTVLTKVNKIRLFVALYSKKGFGLAKIPYFDLFNAHYQCLKIFDGTYETPCV